MSLILDALRRSENGGVAASPQPPLPSEQGGGLGNKWLGVVVLVCAGLGIAAGWMMRGGATDPMEKEQVVSPMPGSPSSGDSGTSSELVRDDVMSSAPGPELSPPTPLASAADTSFVAAPQNNAGLDAARAEDERIAALHQQMWSDAASLGAAEGQGAEPSGAPISAAEKLDAPGLTDPAPATSSSSSPSIAPPIDLVAAIERAAREVGEPSLVPHPAVLLENLSQQQKDQIPTIVYTEHIYADGAAPLVELNGQRLRPGQRTGAITVEDILVDSVILRVNGVSFRLRALNTWVNL
jgi:general secretion pathway protein B